jgi:inositol polyphosphate 5-phosphatase INPP5B/F
MFGMLIPGEPTSKIDLTISIGKDTAKLLNSGREVLEDVLILRLENGRDYYLTIRASYARSCFGMSMEELVLYSQPIRTIPIDPIERAKHLESSTTPAAPTTALCVPKELWRVVDAIYAKGINVPNLFVDPGLPHEIASIRECLDTGTPFTPCSVHSYTDVMIAFISSLSSPVLPSVFFPSVEIDSQNIQMSARRLLEELPPIHYNVFVYIISFFREVLQHREVNQLNAAKLARIACACLAPVANDTSDPTTTTTTTNAASSSNNNTSSSSSVQKRTGMQLIILHLLETVSI